MFNRKRKVQSWDEHAELFGMLSEAREAITNGSARSGSHYALMNYLSSRFGVRVNGREASMSAASKLLSDFEAQHSRDGLTDEERRYLEME